MLMLLTSWPKHLITNGYKRIAGIFCNEITGIERREGFWKSDQRSQPWAALNYYRLRAKSVRDMLPQKNYLTLPPRPDAIFATDNLVLEGSMQAIHWTWPKNPNRSGFGRVRWCILDGHWYKPPITVIRQPTDEIGRLAVDLIMRRIEDPARPPLQVILKSQLVGQGIQRSL